MIKWVFFTIAYLPNAVARGLGALLGRLLYLIDNREKRVAKINIALCFPELSASAQQRLLKQTLVENAKTLLEIPKVFRKGGDYAISLISEVQGLERFQTALETEKGVILLAPHLGNWELTVHYLNQFSPMVAMFAPPKQAFLNDIMRQARQSSGAVLVPADTSGVRAQLKHLKRGGVVGILPDQQPKSGHAGVFAPFMGNTAYTMLLVNNLAKRTGATVLFTFAERLSAGKGYKLHVLDAPDGIAADDTVVAATALNQGVELCVHMATAQYQWTYKRFKYQPDGHVSPYDAKHLS